MSTALHELIVKFTVNDKAFKGQMDNVLQKVTSFGKTASIAAAAAAGALTAFGLSQMDAVGKANDLATSLGISYSSLQTLSLVAKEAGVEMEALSSSMGRMQNNIFTATSGVGSAYEALKTLGLSASELFALAPDEQFQRIAEKIALIEEPTARTAIAMDLFGKQGLSLMPIFDDFAAKAAESAAFTEKFGIALSQVDAATVDAAGDSMGRLHEASAGYATMVATELSPLMIVLSEDFLDSAYSAEQFRDKVSTSMSVVYGAIDKVRQILIGFRAVLASVLSMVSTFLANVSSLVGQINKFAGLEGAAFNFENMAKGARQFSAEQKQSFLDARNEAENFVTTQEKVLAAQEKIKNSLNNRGTNSPIIVDPESGNDSKKSSKYANQAAAKAKEEMRELRRETELQAREMENLRNSAADTFSGFVESVSSGKGAMESFRTTALNAINDVIQNMFRLSFGGSSSGGIGGMIASSLFSGLNLGGGPSFDSAYDLTQAMPFADGGVINKSTVFPIGHNAGVMGEAGAEGILPLTRTSGGKLGVTAVGGGSGVNVTQNLNFSLGVDTAVRAEIMRQMDNIKKASVTGVEQARQRGVIQ